jgi:hypothetical protein
VFCLGLPWLDQCDSSKTAKLGFEFCPVSPQSSFISTTHKTISFKKENRKRFLNITMVPSTFPLSWGKNSG